MIRNQGSTRQNQVVSTVHGRQVVFDPLRFLHLEMPFEANAIGRSSKTVREFLEKNYKEDMSREESIKLTVKSLLEVVQTGAKNIEISVMEGYNKVTVGLHVKGSCTIDLNVCLKNLELSEIEAIVAEIEREKEAGKLGLTLS